MRCTHLKLESENFNSIPNIQEIQVIITKMKRERDKEKQC